MSIKIVPQFKHKPAKSLLSYAIEVILILMFIGALAYTLGMLLLLLQEQNQMLQFLISKSFEKCALLGHFASMGIV
jgi:hypothetical protein